MRKLALILMLCGCAYGGRPALRFADLPYPWPEKSLQVGSMKLAYVEVNPEGAQTVLLIHGLGSYLKFWRYQIDELAAKGYHVVALDLPGYGKSDKPAAFPYTMEAFAGVVHDVIAELNLGKPILFGHSMGGHIALTFALLYPGEARALVLASPAGFEAFSLRERAWFEAVFRSELVTGAGEEDIVASVRAGNFARWRPELAWLVEERVGLARAPELRAYAYANVLSVRGLSHTAFVRANLGAIDAPVIIIAGADDRLIPNPFMHGGRSRDVMEPAHAQIRGSQLVMLAGCGHSVQLDCPADFNAAAEAFLARLPP